MKKLAPKSDDDVIEAADAVFEVQHDALEGDAPLIDEYYSKQMEELDEARTERRDASREGEKTFDYLVFLEAQFWEEAAKRKRDLVEYVKERNERQKLSKYYQELTLDRLKVHAYQEFEKNHPGRPLPKALIDARVEDLTERFHLFNQMNAINFKNSLKALQKEIREGDIQDLYHLSDDDQLDDPHFSENRFEKLVKSNWLQMMRDRLTRAFNKEFKDERSIQEQETAQKKRDQKVEESMIAQEVRGQSIGEDEEPSLAQLSEQIKSIVQEIDHKEHLLNRKDHSITTDDELDVLRDLRRLHHDHQELTSTVQQIVNSQMSTQPLNDNFSEVQKQFIISIVDQKLQEQERERAQLAAKAESEKKAKEQQKVEQESPAAVEAEGTGRIA